MSLIRNVLVLLCLLALTSVGNGQNSAKRSSATAELKITQSKSNRRTTKSLLTNHQLNTRKVRDFEVKTCRGMMVRRVLLMRSTGYCIGDPHTPGTLTAFTHKRAKFGETAVDPRVIHPGTKLYITGYGFATASDTFLRRDRHGRWLHKRPVYKIDLCYNRISQAKNHGVKTVLIFLLEPIKKERG